MHKLKICRPNKSDLPLIVDFITLMVKHTYDKDGFGHLTEDIRN